MVFSCLWPDDKQTLIDTYRDAELNKQPYDLCKLLLAANCLKTLEALLDEKVTNSMNSSPNDNPRAIF